VEREPGAYFTVAACPQQGDADQIQAPLARRISSLAPPAA
jgi:hypothetical protein